MASKSSDSPTRAWAHHPSISVSLGLETSYHAARFLLMPSRLPHPRTSVSSGKCHFSGSQKSRPRLKLIALLWPFRYAHDVVAEEVLTQEKEWHLRLL